MKNKFKANKILSLTATCLSVFFSAALFTACPEPDSSSEQKAERPAFSPIGGFYTEAQTVSIRCDDAQAIYYTTDLSTPTEKSTKYDEPFEVKSQCVIRALAIKNDGTKRYAMTAFDFDLDRGTDYSGTELDSPNWQDQVIYFILTDRFFNGDTSNDKDDDDFDESVILPGQPQSGYQGGDLKGIEQKLDYIKSLGATAIWITPPIKNQIYEGNYHGYHGYWASDFTHVDSHEGSLADYQSLVSAAHDRGMFVIQDIVVNHTGDYQKIADGEEISSKNIKKNTLRYVFSLNDKSLPYTSPEQLPWKLNNPGLLTEDELDNDSFYHFNATINDFTSLTQRYTWQSSDLDDIATDNAVVENLLRGYFRYWIRKANIDGYRIDTVLYVQPDFFEGFINGSESGNEGTRTYAAALGKSDFINFGEAFTDDEALTSSYTKDSETGAKRMDSIIYFPLRDAIFNCITGGAATANISSVLENRYKAGYQNPDRLVSFIDNHDVTRLYSQLGGSQPDLVKGAYALIMTIPGIPQIYYGAEQGFSHQSRSAMFAGGLDDVGTTQTSDQFNEESEWFTFFKKLISLRKDNRVFRYNTLEVMQDAQSSGLFAYTVHGKAEDGSLMTGKGAKAIYILNTALTDQVMSTECGLLSSGDKFTLQEISSAGYESSVVAGKDGTINIVVPSSSFAVYILSEEGASASDSSNTLSLATDFSAGETIIKNEKTITVKGKTSVSGTVKIVFNADYSHAVEVEAVSEVEFSQVCSITALSNGTVSVQLVQEENGATLFSDIQHFTLDRPFEKVESSCVSDPKGDTTGVGNAKTLVSLPTDVTFLSNSQQDILGVDVYRAGNDIKLYVKMSSVTTTWNPTINKFDHVLFNIFVSDGDSNGCTVQPNRNYTLPEDFHWDYLYIGSGWVNSYYSKIDADSSSYGTAASPAPTSVVDWTKDSDADSVLTGNDAVIVFTFSAASLGYPTDISGYKFYINTWDEDMGALRSFVTGSSTQWKYGTGTCAEEDFPLVSDETDTIIVIP